MSLRKILVLFAEFIFTAFTPLFAQTAVDFSVELNMAGTGVVVTWYKGKGGNIVIPPEIEGLPVMEIGDNAFGHSATITNITLPSTVTVIGDAVFRGQLSLKTITLLQSSTSIGRGAFQNTGLTKITLPGNITNIGTKPAAFGSSSAIHRYFRFWSEQGMFQALWKPGWQNMARSRA